MSDNEKLRAAFVEGGAYGRNIYYFTRESMEVEALRRYPDQQGERPAEIEQFAAEHPKTQVHYVPTCACPVCVAARKVATPPATKRWRCATCDEIFNFKPLIRQGITICSAGFHAGPAEPVVEDSGGEG